MKIATWNEMLAMPAGTIYQEYEPHALGEPKVLGGADGARSSLTCADLMPQAMFGSMYPASDLERLGIRDGDDLIQTPSFHGRDDYYDDKSKYRFLVWEEWDKKRLARWMLMDLDALAEEMNDDNPSIYVVPEKHKVYKKTY